MPDYIVESVVRQDAWKRRIRDLRYLGWTVIASKKRMQGGRVRSFYRLVNFEPWPEDPTDAAPPTGHPA